MKEYSSTQFSKVTGIARKTLRAWRAKGWLLPRAKDGLVYYSEVHLKNPRVAVQMAKHGKQLPAEIPEPPPDTKLTIVETLPRINPEWQVTTMDDLAALPPDPLAKPIAPLNNLGADAYSIWTATLPSLVHNGIQPSALPLLAEYCKAMAQTNRLSNQLRAYGPLTKEGRAMFALVHESRTSARMLATALHLHQPGKGTGAAQPVVKMSAEDTALAKSEMEWREALGDELFEDCFH